MQIMKLYFVRHGESRLNAQKIHQHNDVDLSPKGIQQAKFVANRFRDIPIDIIISSSHLRAQQTAEEITLALKKQIFFTDLLGEIKRPTQLRGKHYDDPEAMHIKDMLLKNARLTDWHFSDEENFYDAKKRAEDFFKYLHLFKEENILAVTHGNFLRVLIGIVLLGESYDHEAFVRFNHVLNPVNTGITLCEVDKHGNWKLITWNDHAHLG